MQANVGPVAEALGRSLNARVDEAVAYCNRPRRFISVRVRQQQAAKAEAPVRSRDERVPDDKAHRFVATPRPRADGLTQYPTSAVCLIGESPPVGAISEKEPTAGPASSTAAAQWTPRAVAW